MSHDPETRAKAPRLYARRSRRWSESGCDGFLIRAHWVSPAEMGEQDRSVD